jgi:hypothetical protein
MVLCCLWFYQKPDLLPETHSDTKFIIHGLHRFSWLSSGFSLPDNTKEDGYFISSDVPIMKTIPSAVLAIIWHCFFAFLNYK